MAKQPLRVILAQPRGFCAGVVRAVDIVERALQIYGAPVYVRHEIVHNKHVVNALREKGARFVEKVSDIPKGAVTVFSAHGVSRKVEDAADGRGLQVIDATCPLVSKVHVEAQRYARQGYPMSSLSGTPATRKSRVPWDRCRARCTWCPTWRMSRRWSLPTRRSLRT